MGYALQWMIIQTNTKEYYFNIVKNNTSEKIHIKSYAFDCEILTNSNPSIAFKETIEYINKIDRIVAIINMLGDNILKNTDANNILVKCNIFIEVKNADQKAAENHR